MYSFTKKLEKDLVTYFQDFQNTSESSDDGTNVVNAPREPFVVKQDRGVNPPHIDECCCECGEALDGIFCQQCTCKSCGKGAHIGYNCPPKKQEEKQIEEEQVANARYWKIDACCDDDDDYNSAIIPILSTEETDNSLKVAEIVILKDEENEDDNLREKLLNVHLLIANIEALKDNPTPFSELLTKSFSTSPKSFLEETNTFHNSLHEFENFCFDLEEISSGSTTTHSDISLLDYEAFSFDNDHIKEISSGSTTTHSDISLSEYDSFIFDPLNNPFPPTNKSDFTHDEFADELVHIISLPDIPENLKTLAKGFYPLSLYFLSFS
nr:hypothetical protein [Tanacetum cinerariifolium]